jgi:hypothetical protein
VTRASAMKKLDIVRKKQVRVDYFLDGFFRIRPVESNSFYDKETVLQVFDQNHFNLVVIELFIFAMVLVLGIFKDYPTFQIPAASSFMLFLTIFVMLSGAFSYWFGGWSATAGLIIFMFVNHLVGEDFFSKNTKPLVWIMGFTLLSIRSHRYKNNWTAVRWKPTGRKF